jgi:hypothetical protein
MLGSSTVCKIRYALVLLIIPMACAFGPCHSKTTFPYTFVSQTLTFVQTIFVFNTYYVHKDIDEAMKLLYQQPTLHLRVQGMVPMLRVEDSHNI